MGKKLLLRLDVFCLMIAPVQEPIENVPTRESSTRALPPIVEFGLRSWLNMFLLMTTSASCFGLRGSLFFPAAGLGTGFRSGRFLTVYSCFFFPENVSRR